MASDVLLIPERGEIRWIDETVSPQSISLLGNSQNQLNFVGYTSAFDATQTPTGGTVRVTINDSNTATLVPGASGYELGSNELRWNLNAAAISATDNVTLIGALGNVLWMANTSKLNIDGDFVSDHVTISQYGVESIALGHSNISGLVGGRIYGSGEESGGLEIASVSNIQIVTGATGGMEMYPRSTGAGGTGELRFRELATNGSHYIALKAADSLANSVIYVLPSTQPVANQVLTASSVTGTNPVTVTLGWATDADTGITSLGGQTGATQTFANDTNVTITSAANTHTLGWTGQLAVSRGGTGASALTSNGVLLGNGTSAIVATAAGTAHQVLRIPGSGGAPVFGAIDLSQSAAVTGALGVTNGGTGTSVQFAPNNIVFAGASGVYSQSNNFTYNTSTGQFSIAATGSAAGILIGGDTQLYRDAPDVLRTPDNLRIDGSIGINEAAPTNCRLSASHTNLSLSADYTTINSSATHTVNSPDTATSRTWAMKCAVVQSGSGNFNDAAAYGATGLEGAGAYSGSGSSAGVTGGVFVARNTGTGTLTRATGIAIPLSNVNTGGGHITHLRSLDIAWETNFSNVNQTRTAIRINSGPTNADSFTGSIVGGIWFHSNSGTAVDGILWGTSGDTNLYRSADNVLATDDNFEIRGGMALRLRNPANTKQSTFASGAQAVAINYTLPTTAPSTNDVLKATTVTGTDPVTVTLGWAADADTGITSLGGQTGATQTFANDTNVTISSAANTHTLGWTGQLAVSRGGTGASTLTSNGVLLGNGTSAIVATAAGTAHQVLRIPGSGGAPVFGAIDLSQSAAVTGALGVTNGGTGTDTQFTAGSVVFAGASGVYSQDNTNFFWDDSNNRLGIGTATPARTLHVSNGSKIDDVAIFETNGYPTHQLTALGGIRVNSNGVTAAFHTAADGGVNAADTGGYTDITATTNTGTVNITNGGAQFNRVYLGWYDGLPRRVAMYTGGGGTNGVGGTIQWEVWNGSAWTTTGVTGSNLTADLASVVLPTTATSRTTINGVSAFWIRGTVATAYSTAPVVRVSAVNFSQNTNAPWVGTGLFVAPSTLTSSILANIVSNQSTSQAALCIVTGGQGQQDIIQVYNFAGGSVWRVAGDGSINAGFSDNTFRNLTLNGGASNQASVLTLVNGSKSQTSWLTEGALFRSQAGTRTNSSTAASGTAATAVFHSFAQPTLAATNPSVTTTDAANVYIANAPAAGTNMTITNAYALWVDDGRTRLDGQLLLPTTGSSAGIVLGGDVNIYRSAADTLRTDDSMSVGRRVVSGVVTLTDGPNISLDASLGNHFRVTLGGNRTLNAPTNAVDGQKITIEVIQDNTGSRTLTLATGSSGAFIFGTDITNITLSTAANKRDIIGCIYSSSLDRWMVVSFVKGF